MAYVEDTILAGAGGAAMVGTATGGIVQGWFDEIDLLDDAAGDGSTDDSAHFEGTGKAVIVLRQGKTYYFGSDATVTAKVVSHGGMLKRGRDVKVTLAGGLEAPVDTQVFDLSNFIDPSTWEEDVQIDATTGEFLYRLGFGDFVVHGDVRLRWFIPAEDIGTDTDQSAALTALARTGCHARQIIDTDCSLTFAPLGVNVYWDARLTQVEAEKTYARNNGSLAGRSRSIRNATTGATGVCLA